MSRKTIFNILTNISLALLISVFASSCGKQEPVSQISLNGTWHFFASNEVTEDDLLASNFADWDTITVPGNWDTREKYAEYVGKGYYSRTFEIPENWQGKQVRLNFDAVYQKAKVWVNGTLLGEHIGGYTPFEFNITDVALFDKPNSVLVMADNTYKRGAWWAWGGISRDVSLRCNENVRLVYQHISAIPDFEKGTVNFTIKYKVENNADKSFNVLIESAIKTKAVATYFEIAANQTTIAQKSFEENLQDYDLWHFNNPTLYSLKSELKIDDRQYDATTDKFGIRKLEARGEQLYLNNEPVRMNGLNRVHDHPDYGNTEPYHLALSDMQDIKSLGCNFSRLMHAPLAESILDVCDNLGFLVIEEIPIWGDDDPQAFPDNPQTKAWLKEMVERDFNHPSVVGWSVGNELRDPLPDWGKKTLTPEQYGYVNSMLDYLDELDTTRLKTYVSLTAGNTTANKSNEPFERLDFICLNSYGDAVKKVQQAHANFPGKPIFLSEIGRAQIGPAPDAKLSEDLLGDLNKLKKFPYLIGVSLWSYNDYRSNYKGTPESGFREWGIVDERRDKKVAYRQLKEIYKKWDD